MLRLPLLFTLWSAACALISDLTVDNDDRLVFHISSFGFEAGGVFKATVTDFSLMVPHDYAAPSTKDFRIAFVLQRSPSDAGVRLEGAEKVCFHEQRVGPDDDIIMVNDREAWKKITFQKTITEPGYYHLYFSNCQLGVHSSFEIQTEEYNVNEDGSPEYLPIGLASLPTWYLVLCFVFVGLLAGWFHLLRKQWKNVKSIHWLMMTVLVLKILTLLFETIKIHDMKTDGVNDGWAVLFYIFSFLKGMMLMAVIVLIGTGWSYLKPFLTDRDKQIILVVMVIQAMVNIAFVVVDEAAPGSYGGMRWKDLLHLLDIICCIMILCPIFWSIRHLRAAAGADGKAARNMARLKNFRTFYLLVVSYIYFTRIIVFLMEATLPYTLAYLGPVFEELAAVVFYTTTGILFRPQDSNPYLALSKDDDNIRDIDMPEL